MSNNLDLSQVAPNQTNKEITINDANGQLDAAFTEAFTADVSAGNVTLTNTQFRRNIAFLVTGAATAGRRLEVPAVKRFFVARNASSTDSIVVRRGATDITVPPETTYIFYTDGSADGIITVSAQAAYESVVNGGGSFTGNGKKVLRINTGETAIEYVAAPYDIGLCLPGSPTALQKIDYVCARAFTLPDNFSGSRGYARTSDATGVVFDVEKNGSVIGTVSFGAGSNTATFNTTGSSTETFAAGDRLSIVCPASLGTLADVAITFLGTRND